MPAFENEKEILSPSSDKIKLLKWKVRKGTVVYKGSVLALYSLCADGGKAPICKLKADEDGTVAQIVAEEGEIIQAKSVILKVQAQTDQGCTHPTIMKDMCANCGADLRIENGISGDRKKSVSASVAMVHSIPELIVSQEQALELGKEDENRLLRQKKLVLLVDLDQTLIHTTNDQIPSNLKDVKHFQLWDGRGFMWYHTRFRPFTEKFLEAVSKMYELHICTFGVRMYAHTIVRLLDPEEKYFSHRILSRDECFDNLSKTANLKALFPCGDKMVGIIDDREDVWNFAPNLVHVKAYRFFQGTADINAPPGLTKTEHDNIPITHKTVVSGKVSSSCENDASKDNLSELDASKTTGDVAEDDVQKKSGEASLPIIDGDKKEDDAVETNEKGDSKGGDDDNMDCSEEKSEMETEDAAKPTEGTDDKANADVEKSEMETEDAAKPTEGTDDKANADVEKYEMETEDAAKPTEGTDDKANATATPDVEKSDVDTDSKNDKSKSEKSKDADAVDVTENKNLANDEGGANFENKYEASGNDSSDKTVKDKTGEEGTNEIEWEDSDDYLLHLEEVLTRIHQAYYNMYEQSVKSGSSQLPDLKNIIPYVKKKVLKGANIVFSGMFPVNMPAERSKAYITAKALGANVQTDIVPNKSKKSSSPGATTHLVAAKAGTIKYKSALKAKGVHVVSGDWLWACAERWEWVTEQIFLLPNKKDGNDSVVEGKEGRKIKKNDKRKRRGTPKENENSVLDDDEKEEDVDESSPAKKIKGQSSGTGKKKKDGAEGEEGQFASSYNPLLSFSNEDIEFMGKEVDEMMAEDEGDSDESAEARDERLRKKVLGDSSASDSDSDSLAGDFPRGWKMRRKSLSPPHKNASFEEGAKTDQEEGDETESEIEQYHKTVEAFSPRDSDQESYSSGDSIGSVDEEIAAAVEKEFLGGSF